MIDNPLVLRPVATLQEAARLFLENKVTGAPVVDADHNLLGLFGNNQLFQAVACGDDCSNRVEDYMLKNPITVAPHEDIEVIKDADDQGQIPVIDGSKIVGTIYQNHLASLFYDELLTVINSTYNAIVSIDSDENINIFNPAAEKLLGKKRTEVLGAPFLSLFPNGRLPKILQSGNAEPTQNFEFNGQHFISNRTPIIVDGKVVGAVAILQDVSDFDAVFKELQSTTEIKEELDAIIESSFDGIFVTDGRGRVIHANEAYKRITGINMETVLGKTMDELVAAGLYDKSVSMLVRERLEPVTLTQEVNTGKTVLVTGNPIFDKEGNLFRVVTNVRDITELNTLKKEVQHLYLQEKLKKAQLCENFIARSPKTKELLDLIIRLGQVDSTVLILGESGVGKEMVANILHSNSIRKDKPIVHINCGAIPENLLESELFGYEAGAFTGAQKHGKAGLFQIADKGVLFLDEIGELSLNLQVKLLRAIQESEITPVGGIKPVKIDVRIIAATNRNLWDMVSTGSFRRDLFYRLNVVPVNVPPLRERREEIPALVYHVIKKLNGRYGLNKTMDEKVIERLFNYDWPGNIRELENIIERAYVTMPGNIIEDVKLESSDAKQDEIYQLKLPDEPKLKNAVEELEKLLILDTLKRHGSTRKAAVKLGVSQPTVCRKAARYGIRLADYEPE